MLQGVRVCLNRSVKRAMARDKVKRDVVVLTEVPAGRPGRPSKSLTPEQADGVLSWWTVALGGIMIMRPLGGRIRLRWSSGRRSVRTLAGVLSKSAGTLAFVAVRIIRLQWIWDIRQGGML